MKWSYSEMGTSPQRLKRPITWALFYAHRYIRLTPPYLIFIAFFTAFLRHLTHGPRPLTMDFWEEATVCEQKWWHNLLYVNNLEEKQVKGDLL